MAEEKFNSFFLVLFRRSPSVEKSIAEDKLVPVKETCPRSQTGGFAANCRNHFSEDKQSQAAENTNENNLENPSTQEHASGFVLLDSRRKPKSPGAGQSGEPPRRATRRQAGPHRCAQRAPMFVLAKSI